MIFNIKSHLSEWLSSINQQTHVGWSVVKGNPQALLAGMQTGAATVESKMELLQKTKNGTAFWPSDSPSGTMSRETQNTNFKEYMQPFAHCSIIYISQDLEVVYVSIIR